MSTTRFCTYLYGLACQKGSLAYLRVGSSEGVFRFLQVPLLSLSAATTLELDFLKRLDRQPLHR